MDPWLSFKVEIKPSASGRSECEDETLTFWIRTRLWLSPAHQIQPALESAPVVLVWFNYRRGLCLIGVYVGHYTQQTQCVFTSSAGYIRRFGWWWKKFHLRITDVFFLPLSFVWSLPPSPSFSLPPSLVVFSRVARSFLDSLMENHHHTEAKFLLSLSQSDKSLGLQLLLKPVVGLSEPCPSCTPPHSLPGPDEIHDQCLSRHNPRRSFCQTCVYTERNESEAADMKRASEGRSGEGGLNSV